MSSKINDLGAVTPQASDITNVVVSPFTPGSDKKVTMADVKTFVNTDTVPNTRQVNGHALTADVTVTSSDVGLGNVDDVQQLPMSYLDTDGTLAANSDSKVASQKATKTYVDSLVSAAIILQGDWNADTNTPDISTETTTGYAWRVSVAGSTNLGGITSWDVGDLAVKTDTGWLKVDNSDIQAVWGNITGTLSNQSDLQAALNAKITGGAGSNERIVFWTGASTVSSDSLFVYSSQRVGIGTASPGARLHLKTSAPGPALTLDLPTGASYESMYFMKAQNTNDYGVYQKLLGGATSSTPRGYFGFAHTGTGGDTILTGELADSLCLRAQGALHLAASGDAIVATMISGRTGFGTTSPNASAQIDMTSTSRGFLKPRMTTAQRNAISSPAVGLEIYNTDTYQNETYNGSSWMSTSSYIPRVSTATSYIASVANYYIGVTDTSLAPTITLPAAATVGAGKVLVIKDESGGAGTNNITIDGNGSETVDGGLTFAINNNYGSVNLMCDGSNWFIW